MKPYGLTYDLQVTRPTRAMDMIWDAVEQAIIEGLTPRQIKLEMAEAWEHALKEQAKEARTTLTN